MKNLLISFFKSAYYTITETAYLAWRGTPLGEPSRRPLVSVYIPTHNRRELLLSRALPSVLNQTYRNLEIIIAAHGCTDGTQSACYDLKDKRIKVISVPRTETYPPTVENHWFAGRVVASNAGLDACTGEWIATLDDDDVWFSDHIEVSLRHAIYKGLEFTSAAGATNIGKIEPYVVGGVKVGPIQTWFYRGYLKSFKFNIDCWRKVRNRVCDTDLQERFRRAGVKMGYLDRVNVKVLPRPGDKHIGLKAARENATTYMNHLSF